MIARDLLLEMGHTIHELEEFVWLVTKGAKGVVIKVNEDGRSWQKLDTYYPLPIEYQLDHYEQT